MYVKIVIENEHGISTSSDISVFYVEIGMKMISKYFERRNFNFLFEYMKRTLMAYFLPLISGCVTPGACKQ